MSLKTSTLLTEEEISIRKQRREKTYFQSHFSFLSSHKGFRPSNHHLLLATASGGKSTLLRSLLIDVANNEGKKAGVFLSEDSKSSFLDDMSFTGYTNNSSIKALSETDLRIQKASEVFGAMKEFISQDKLDVLFFDNLTTSCCYEGRTPSQQGVIARKLKELAIDFNIPVVSLIHTKKGVDENYKGIIGKDDVRGASTIVNLSEFLYVMQTFYIGNKRVDMLRTCKHRGQVVEKKIHKLTFHKEKMLYIGDQTIDFDEFKSVYTMRNKLTER